MTNDFNGGITYKRNSGEERAYYNYRVFNLPPAPSKKQVESYQPGIKMTKSVKQPDNTYLKTHEVVKEINAVILYASQARTLKGGNGRPLCQSSDGVAPSLTVEKPLCGKATTEDLVKIIGKWKGMDKAKVDAKVKELTSNDRLKVCGIKTATGVIALCPYATRDAFTGKKGECVPLVKLTCYDIDRKRIFEMELSKEAIALNKFTKADYHKFMEFAQEEGNPCYNYKITLYPKKETIEKIGLSYYSAGFTNPEYVQSPLKEKLVDLAHKARDMYIRKSLPKEQRQQQEQQNVRTAAAEPEVQEPVIEESVIDELDKMVLE